MRDAQHQQQFRPSDLRRVAEELIADLAKCPGWQRHLEQGRGPGGAGTAILISRFENRTTDPLWEARWWPELRESLVTVLARSDVAVCDEDGGPARRVAYREMDDRTEVVRRLPGNRLKATAVMGVSIAEARLPWRSGDPVAEYRFRIVVHDAALGAVVASAEVTLQK